ncbi:hypothetical protein GGR57DRAFT_515983 [Xylariaceae sp. FL1272]|nr:hypothetical protein GGR57DRAFT_515983 [Xylariaceae sp. FL1272]
MDEQSGLRLATPRDDGRISYDVDSELEAAVYFNPKSVEAAHNGDKELFKTGAFSDVTVVCGTREWKLHQAILATRSEWFKKALSGGFQEARTKIITFPELDADALDIVFRWIYALCTHSLEPINPENWASPGNLLKLCNAWLAADYLLLSHLRDGIECEYEAVLYLRLHDIASGSPEVHNSLEEQIQDVHSAVKLIYESGIEPLRKHSVEGVVNQDMRAMDVGSMRDIIDEVPEYGKDLIATVSKHMAERRAQG